jgi:hypothetical protein
MSARAVQTLTRLVVTLGLLLAIVRCGSAQIAPAPAVQLRNANCSLKWSYTQLYVRELTGNNDGKEVEAYLRLTGNRKGDSWCGAFQAAVQRACGLSMPVGAGGSYNWFLDLRRTYYVRGRRGTIDQIQLGDKVGFFYPNLGRIGHILLVVRESRPVRKGRPARGFILRSGNTGKGGGRNGSGVWDLYFDASIIYSASNWKY